MSLYDRLVIPTPGASDYLRRDVESLTLVRICRESRNGPELMQAVMPRVARMSHRFGSTLGLVNSCWQLFATQSPVVGIWALIENESVVGHAVGQIVEYEWRYVAWIYHVECDHPISIATMDEFIADVEAWVAEYNKLQAHVNPSLCVYEIMMNSHRGVQSKAWERHGGFEQHRIIFRRLLHGTIKAINTAVSLHEQQTKVKT